MKLLRGESDRPFTLFPLSLSSDDDQDTPPTLSGLLRPLVFYMQSIFLIKKILKFHSDGEMKKDDEKKVKRLAKK